MLISEEYRKLNEQYHRELSIYGTGSKVEFINILELCDKLKSIDVLDYGCGKALSWKKDLFQFKPKLYDPAFPEYSVKPDPADIVLCLGVLEHVEPELLDNVLDDLFRCVKKIGVFLIDLKPSRNTLPDGSYPHRIVESIDWWKNKLDKYWDLSEELDFKNGKGFWITVVPKGNNKIYLTGV